MLVGISSGATLAAIAKKLEELEPGTRVLGFNYGDEEERDIPYFDVLTGSITEPKLDAPPRKPAHLALSSELPCLLPLDAA